MHFLSFPRTLSHLYQSADWSRQDLSRPIGEIRRHMTKCKLSCFSLESLKYYAKELKLRKQEGYKISSVDFWGLLLEKALDDGVVLFLCFPFYCMENEASGTDAWEHANII